MALDVLEQGREPERPPRDPRRPFPRGAVLVASLLVCAGVVAAGTLAGRQEQPAPPALDDAAAAAGLRPPLPRVLVDRATVLRGHEEPHGVVALDVRLQGFPGAQLLSLDVALPGSAVVLAPLPDRLSPDGTAQISLQVLPQCPEALPGLSRAAVTGVVRGREGTRVRQVRVRLDTAGALAEVVRARCGAVAGAPELTTPLVELAGPAADDALRTTAQLATTGAQPVTVVAVQPGPGLAVRVRTPLPVRLVPGGAPVSLLVDLRGSGCGGAPDTPPYLLALEDGTAVATSAGAGLQGPLDALRPYQCAG